MNDEKTETIQMADEMAVLIPDSYSLQKLRGHVLSLAMSSLPPGLNIGDFSLVG
jgi:hypothetical protein